MSKYEEEFEILQYRCKHCGRSFPCQEGKRIICPQCKSENNCYVELKHDGGGKRDG